MCEDNDLGGGFCPSSHLGDDYVRGVGVCPIFSQDKAIMWEAIVRAYQPFRIEFLE